MQNYRFTAIHDDEESFTAIQDKSRVLKDSVPEMEIVGLKGGLSKVYKKAVSVAKYPVPVLLTGKTGTGKEVIAKLIHRLSGRLHFISVNCAAIPSQLLESELFGHMKGAFTGASRDKPGKVELADGGTLFLDEIGELKPELQAKLLRVLQEKQVERVGSVAGRKVDFRLILATNKNLERAVKEGEFREDLFFRINTFPISLPSLVERKMDIPALVHYYLQKLSRDMNIAAPAINRNVLTLLENHSWPGNIRELMNVIQRALILGVGNGQLTANDFFINIAVQEKNCVNFDTAIKVVRSKIINKELHLKDIEKIVLTSVLEYCNNNVVLAVEQTGISRDKFYRNKAYAQLPAI